MKTYYGNYLGLVVNSSDPEYRGRVQIFIPHVMPALYDGWNKEGTDIQISCVGSNIPEGLTPEIHQRLVQILPWAEAASPIIGGSAPGNLFSSMVAGAAAGASTGGVIGAVTGAVAAGVNHIFNQGPTSQPIPVQGGDAQGLVNRAKQISGLAFDGKKWGKCARGTTALDKAAGLIDNNGPSAGFYAASDLAAGGTNRTGYNPYTTGTGAKYFRQPFTTDPALYKPQIGDSVFAGGGGGENHGHAQKCIGLDKQGNAIWASDNIQSKFFTSNKTADYTNFTVYRLNDVGVARYAQAIGADVTNLQPPTTLESEPTAASAASAPPNPQAKPEGLQEGDTAPTPQTTMTASGPGTGAPAGTVSGGGTATNSGVHKGKTIVSATGVNGSGLTTVTYSDGTTATLNQPRPIRNNNPGNLEYGSFAKKMGAVGSDGRYAVFPTAEAGASAKVALLKTSTYQNLSIRDAFNRYAPPSENPNYLRDLQSGTGFDMSRKMSSLSVEEFNKLTSTVAKIEGFDSPLPSGSELPPSFSTPNVVNNTDSNGRTPVVNTNDMASGLFAYPNPGAMVWVFFREGNPLYPVYFAASYSSAEWSSAYRGSSPSESYTNDGQIIGTGTVMHFGPEGGIKTQNRANINDPLDNNSSLTLFHQHGSGITMKNGCDFYRSAANKRDEVDNDRHTITRGYKEEWTQGDESTNVRGDTFIKVGNISQEAIDAMNELSEMSYKLNQQLMEKPKS